MAEFPNVGNHCSFETCKQLDFLSFVCDSCTKTFCLDHKFPDKHSCSLEFATFTNKKYEGVKKMSSQFLFKPQTSPGTQMYKVRSKGRKCQTALHVQKILESKPSKQDGKKPKKASKTAAKVALMKMKMKATGEKGIPEPEKVYMLIYLPKELSLAAKPMYFSKTWSFGRCIDFVASSVQMKNENNTGSEKKLRLFNHESGQLLPMEKTLDSLLSEEVIFSGSSVILEYVTTDCCQLENTEDYKT
ncbi:unnamed protein product [Mytilus coruscus]|uniref:AN1-type domain-containing protein n=1 Tax=Mytilus coruscus TaxID=42192 RepID=A0A6J8BWW8_MYTCO|nr:unnamed protein product [Mytilus coruscus]